MSALGDHPDVIRAELDGLPVEGDVIGSVSDVICQCDRVEIGTHRSPTYGRAAFDGSPAVLGTLDIHGDAPSTLFLDAKALRTLSALCLIAADILEPTP